MYTIRLDDAGDDGDGSGIVMTVEHICPRAPVDFESGLFVDDYMCRCGSFQNVYATAVVVEDTPVMGERNRHFVLIPCHEFVCHNNRADFEDGQWAEKRRSEEMGVRPWLREWDRKEDCKGRGYNYWLLSRHKKKQPPRGDGAANPYRRYNSGMHDVLESHREFYERIGAKTITDCEYKEIED